MPADTHLASHVPTYMRAVCVLDDSILMVETKVSPHFAGSVLRRYQVRILEIVDLIFVVIRHQKPCGYSY